MCHNRIETKVPLITGLKPKTLSYWLLVTSQIIVDFMTLVVPLVYLLVVNVQFKTVSIRSERPLIMRCCTRSLKNVSTTLPLKQFQCSSDWRRLSLVLARKVFERFLFPCLSSPGDRRCVVLGYVLVGRVSSSSTLQIFWDANHLWWLRFPAS